MKKQKKTKRKKIIRKYGMHFLSKRIFYLIEENIENNSKNQNILMIKEKIIEESITTAMAIIVITYNLMIIILIVQISYVMHVKKIVNSRVLI